MSNHTAEVAFFMIVAAIVGATIAADLGTYLNEFVPKGRSYASIGSSPASPLLALSSRCKVD